MFYTPCKYPWKCKHGRHVGGTYIYIIILYIYILYWCCVYMCIVVCISSGPKSQSFPRFPTAAAEVRISPTANLWWRSARSAQLCAKNCWATNEMGWGQKSNLGNAMSNEKRSTSSINGFPKSWGYPKFAGWFRIKKKQSIKMDDDWGYTPF
jgi:hypothetical protein